MKRVGDKHIQHRSHHHNLTLLEAEKDDHPSCGLCSEELGFSPSYGCELCPFFLHKSCAELPGQIKTHLHVEHPIFLFATTQSREKTYCGYCAGEVRKLNYRCLQCGFTLHVDCFFSQHNLVYDHHHSFVQIKKVKKLACDACGDEGHFSPWQCTACHLMVHKKCADLSRFIRIDRHKHALKLTYFLSFVDEYHKAICRVCYREVNVDYAAYYCHLCKYVAHLSCGQEIGVAVSEEETLEGSHDFIANSGESNRDASIQHLTHRHELILNEQNPEEDYKYCDGCVTFISSLFYSCNDCGFYLHKQCAEMPTIKKYSRHPHPLHLNPLEEGQYSHYCDECEKTYNGFEYSCQFKDCSFNIDFHCVKVMEGVDHPFHEHRLHFPDPMIRCNETCHGCGGYSELILVCAECQFVLGFCCAKLPHRVKHRYDEHLLILSLKEEDEFGEYYCDVCENERKPIEMFYCCIRCDFFAHIECALGDYPYIKYGTTRTFPFHDHPLAFVEQPARRKPPPLCRGCGKHCYSRVLECLQCSFSLHHTASCIDEISRTVSPSLLA